MKTYLKFSLACLLFLFFSCTSKVLPTIAHGALDYGVDELQKLHQGGIIRVGLEKTSANEYKTPLGFISYQVIIQKNEGGKDSLIVAYRINYPIIKDSAHRYIDRKLQPKQSYNFDMKKANLMGLSALLESNFWLLDKSYADRIIPILQHKISGNSNFRLDDLFDMEDEEDEPYNRDGIAVIPLRGTMTYHGGLCAKGVKHIIEELKSYEKNAAVSAIVFDVDTNGGEASGIQELYNAVRYCTKPVVAICKNNMASAGYYAMCGADAIYMNTAETSSAGSIGVYMVIPNYSEQNKMLGIEYTYITSEKSTEKIFGNPDNEPSKDAIAYFTQRANELHEAFIRDVKAVRGKNLSDAIFTGRSFNGVQCVENGLADAIGGLEQAILKAKNLAMRTRMA